jgi:hypothetical protein
LIFSSARHIEPSQVATYESVKYQDILDDLVTVTDQDVLSHVQAAAANEPTVISTNFSFALIEATNEIIKTTENHGAEETASAFVDLQYFYPIEQEQELLQKQLEQCEEKEEEEDDDDDEEEEESTVVLPEKFETEIIPSAESPKSNEDSTITDLASIIQINRTHASSPITETTPSIDYDTLLPPPPPPAPPEFPAVFDQNSRKACIIFEPIFSPTNPSSPEKSSENELILESGCLTTSSIEKSNPLNTNQIEDLLNETTNNQYEIIENQGQTSSLSTDVTLDNLDNLMEQIEEPTKQILEKNFYHYQQMYQENLKKKPKEQYSPIPSVKLKLHSIYLKHKKKRKSSPSPVLICENVRPPLKIKIRTKLPSPSPLPKDEPLVPKIKIRKPIKKLKRKKASIDDQLEQEAKLSLKTEYAGLTRFEQSLAQFYHQQSSPDTQIIPPTPGENEDLTILSHKQDTPPTNETKLNFITSPGHPNKKLSHLLNYDDEPLNNNTYITPPPEIDAHIHQDKTSNDTQHNPKKMKRKSQQNPFHNKEYCSSSSRKQELLPPSQSPSIHIDPYTQAYHHFDARTAPFFNFPFPNPFMTPHAATASTHFHPNTMKYHYPTHTYPTHQQSFPYHPHLQRQPQYNNSNYMCKFKKSTLTYIILISENIRNILLNEKHFPLNQNFISHQFSTRILKLKTKQ